MRYVDLSQTFTGEMPVYPGDPPPELKPVATLEKDGVTCYQATTGMHVGTHIDAPLHMLPGRKISEIPVERFFGKGLLVDARNRKEVDEDLLEGLVFSSDHIVLIWTGFSTKYRSAEYYRAYPVITEAFAKKLVEAKVKMVGMDTPSPDLPPFAVHKILLGTNILIIENLANLEGLEGVKDMEIVAVPVKFEAEAALARVIAKIA